MTDNRKEILRVAQAILEEAPASDFSSREVARRAGVSVSVVHYHFANRDGLIQAAYDDAYYDGLVELSNDLREELGSGAPFEALLRTTTIRVFRYARSRGQLFRNFLSNVVERGDLGATDNLSQQDRMLRLVCPFVARHGGIGVAEARLRTSYLVMLVARLASSSTQEMLLLLGEDDVSDPVARVEASLSDVAVRILLGDSKQRS